MSTRGRTVACPYCSTRYLLPLHLLGSAGAQVTCPSCERTFVVAADEPGAPASAEPEGEVPAEAPTEAEPPSPSTPARKPIAEAPPSAEGPEAIARAILDSFAEGREDALREAGRVGRFFADYGPEVMQAYDAFRREVGRDADPKAFRDALARRFGVELDSGEPADER